MMLPVLLLCFVVGIFTQLHVINDKYQIVGRNPHRAPFRSNPLLSEFGQGSPRFSSPFQPIFTLFDGRTADPCNKYIQTGPEVDDKKLRDCQSVPSAQSTVLLPVAYSNHIFAVGVVSDPQTADGILTITGEGFNSLTAGNLFFAMADPRLGCQSLSSTTTDFVAATVVDDNTITFLPTVNWISQEKELSDVRWSLCFSKDARATYGYTGFNIQVVWHCIEGDSSRDCANQPPSTVNPTAGYDSLTYEELQQRKARTKCCRSTVGSLLVGQCIFSSSVSSGAPTTCCGGARVESATERCCNSEKMWVSWYDTSCPCLKSDELVGTLRCPTGELCCTNSKYPEFEKDVSNVGECYNPVTHRCCTTGMRYDPGAQQCCAITGVQSLNTPCPCSTDEHCRGGSVEVTAKEKNLRCCQQVDPTPMEIQQCSTYSNYPLGFGPYQAARCNGVCLDPDFQICCNGVLCVKSYEKCCNATCCNRFTQTCERSFRRPAPGYSSNPTDFFVRYEVCSTTEQMTPHKALWLFVYPCIWLLMTFFSTGLVLVFANKAASRSYAGIEQAIITVALLLILFSLVLYFCPAFKYAIVILFVQLVAILTAASRVFKLNLVCAILHVLLIIYLVDPFHGNQWLTLSYHRLSNGRPDRETAGLMHTVSKMWKSSKSVESEHWCPNWYLGYGKYDELLRDTDRFDNPEKHHFGYCTRAYIALLLIFSSIIVLLALVQLMLVIMALLLRFTKPTVKLIVREEYDSGDEVPVY